MCVWCSLIDSGVFDPNRSWLWDGFVCVRCQEARNVSLITHHKHCTHHKHGLKRLGPQVAIGQIATAALRPFKGLLACARAPRRGNRPALALFQQTRDNRFSCFFLSVTGTSNTMLGCTIVIHANRCSGWTVVDCVTQKEREREKNAIFTFAKAQFCGRLILLILFALVHNPLEQRGAAVAVRPVAVWAIMLSQREMLLAVLCSWPKLHCVLV